MIEMIAQRPFSSTIWGNVDQGARFEVEPGYVAELEKEGLAKRSDAAHIDELLSAKPDADGDGDADADGDGDGDADDGSINNAGE